jgi:transposase
MGGDGKKKLQHQQPEEKMVFFDEFAVYERPSLFYGWAERNTRPQVNSDERTRHKLNGFLCVDALTGEEFLRLSPHAKTEDISLYLAEFCLDCVELGVSKLCIILDNNPTHKQKMRAQLATHLQQMGLSLEITVEFLYVPPYSPKLNLVEYVIHLLRLRFLHHLPLGTTLVEIEQQLEQFLQSHQFLASQQVRKTLNFIFSLVA